MLGERTSSRPRPQGHMARMPPARTKKTTALTCPSATKGHAIPPQLHRPTPACASPAAPILHVPLLYHASHFHTQYHGRCCASPDSPRRSILTIVHTAGNQRRCCNMSFSHPCLLSCVVVYHIQLPPGLAREGQSTGELQWGRAALLPLRTPAPAPGTPLKTPAPAPGMPRCCRARW